MTSEELAAFKNLLKRTLPGPRIEMGVFQGATLQLIAQHDGQTIGVDSFEGMAEPTERDVLNGWNPYPTGRFSTSTRKAAHMAPKAMLVQGFVPAVLENIHVTGFAFAHLDMDHYDPTLHALRWLWPRMLKGGILCCDDWFADRAWLAAGAINEFSAEIHRKPESVGRKAWWVC